MRVGDIHKDNQEKTAWFPGGTFLKNPKKMEKMMADLKNVQLKIKGGGASNKAATHILELN